MSPGAACEIGCFPHGLKMWGDCRRRRVDGVCICHCHQPLCYQPHPIHGYPSLFRPEPKLAKGNARG